MLFDNIRPGMRKKHISKKINPVIRDCKNPKVYIVLENFIKNLPLFEKFLINILKHDNFKIICAFDFKVLQSEVKNHVTSFYYFNHVDFRKLIPSKSKVITFGKALYCFSHDHLSIVGMYDTILDHNSFYSPEFDVQVYPCPFLDSFLRKDTFERWFTIKQLQALLIFSKEIKQYDKVKVDDVNNFIKAHTPHEGDMGFDIETVGLDPYANRAKILCFTITFDGNTGYFLDFDNIDISLLPSFFKNKNLIGSNLKFDCKWVHVKCNVPLDNLYIKYDTVQASNIINELQFNGLKSDAFLLTANGGYEKELEFFQYSYPKTKTDYSKIPAPILFKYSVLDPIMSWEISKEQIKIMKKLDNKYPVKHGWSIVKYYQDIVMPSVNVFLKIDCTGMLVDWHKVKDLEKEYLEKINNKKQIIYKSFNASKRDFDLDSQFSLGKFLEQIKWPCIKRGKDKTYLTNDECLKLWIKQGYTQAKLIEDYRSLRIMYNTFIKGMWQYKNTDYTVKPTFGVMMTNTHRNNCKNPNLQNQPKKEFFRKLYIPPSSDYTICEQDGAGLQLRIVGVLSGDKNFYKAFNDLSGDIHSLTATKVFMQNVSLEDFMENKKNEPYYTARFNSKAVNFSIVFNTTGRSFAIQSIQPNWSLEKAKEYVKENNLENTRKWLIRNCKAKDEFSYYWTVAIDIKNKFFESYPQVKDWINNNIAIGKRFGVIQSKFGALRRLPYLLYQGKDDDKYRIKNYENISCNSPVQNFEIVQIMMTIIALDKYIKKNNLKTKIVGQVHDSIVMYLYKNEKEKIIKKAKEVFEKDYPFYEGMKFELEAEIGDVWGFGKEVKL